MRSGLPLLLALLVSLASVRCDRPTPQPNVILIVVDTLRKDHLGVYGHTRPTSPNIDTLASSAVRYTRAFSQAPWTTPSVAALLTSLYPSHLDILHLPHRLSHDFELLPEVLQANGYATGAVISHDLLGSTWNFDQGYDEFYEELAQGHEFVSSPDVTDRARHAGLGALEDDDIGADRVGVDSDAVDETQVLGDDVSILMIFGESLDHFVEGDDSGRSQDAGLSHGAAEELSDAVGLVDECFLAAEERADGGAESFGHAEHDGVETPGELFRLATERDRGVEDPGAIEVDERMSASLANSVISLLRSME